MRNYHDDLSLPVRKSLYILFHLIKMFSGKWSTEASQEDKDDGTILQQIGKVRHHAVRVFC